MDVREGPGDARAGLALEPWTLASLVCFVLASAVTFRLVCDSGLTLDEDAQRRYGDLIIAWFVSLGADERALRFRNLYLYGGLFDLAVQSIHRTGISPWRVYDLRHVLTALTAMLGVVATWKTARELGGPRAGFIAAAFLALTPAWVGHGLFNPKDIPFATAAAFVQYATICICLKPAPLGWADALRAGGWIGIALAVRPGGMFLLAYPAAAALGRYVLDAALPQNGRADRQSLVGTLGSIALRLLAVLAIAWPLMVSAWPWALLDPIERPLLAAWKAAKFDWQNLMLFDGQHIWSRELPSSYLPTWFLITLPDAYGLAAGCGLVALARRPRAGITRGALLGVSFLLLSIVVPLLGVVLHRPVIYDAQRHFLFLIPPLATLAGLGVSRLLSDVAELRWLRLGILAAFVVLAGVTMFDMARLHPYQYIYFNRAFGGLPSAAGRFETDYWGAANRAGIEWVNANVHPPHGTRLRIATCHANWQVDYLAQDWPDFDARFELVTDMDRAQIHIATTRDRCNEKPGEVIHVIERLGVPLLYVLRR